MAVRPKSKVMKRTSVCIRTQDSYNVSHPHPASQDNRLQVPFMATSWDPSRSVFLQLNFSPPAYSKHVGSWSVIRCYQTLWVIQPEKSSRTMLHPSSHVRSLSSDLIWPLKHSWPLKPRHNVGCGRCILDNAHRGTRHSYREKGSYHNSRILLE